jgi:hypothetical protein
MDADGHGYGPFNPVSESEQRRRVDTEEEKFVEKAEVMWMAVQCMTSPWPSPPSAFAGPTAGQGRGRIVRRLTENSCTGLITRSRNQK